MNCTCNSNDAITSWIGWQNQQPVDPLSLIARARINAVTGVYVNSTTYLASSPPVASPISLQGVPVCSALGTDSQQHVADAAQWNFQHLSGNTGATLALPLQKVIFLRGGTDWEMAIPLSLGASTFVNFQLSFRNNAGTRGDCAGTIPAIEFSGTFNGVITLSVTLKQLGAATMGLRGIDALGQWSMYESEWIIVP